jgi:23S rRNA (cytidine1920-2'-O)/16S rRNA (cytidine1409-2'-O)-methyltransferase
MGMTPAGDKAESKGPFVSRAGQKLAHALATFGVVPQGWTCADLGCNVGGFTDCLLRGGAERVFAVDTGYGILDYKLRKDPRVVVMERTNAMHAAEAGVGGCDLVVIDVAWTRQRLILPAAKQLLKPGSAGRIISLVKPHYENPAAVRQGLLDPAEVPGIMASVRTGAEGLGLKWLGETTSPVRGEKAGNMELLICLGLCE